MAAAETARLIASLELKDKLTPGVNTATRSLGRLDSGMGKLKRGAGAAGKALAGVGAVAAVGLTAAIKGGLEDLATLESATTSVDGAIKQMGKTGQVTSKQIADWANEIEAATQAAFDDKAITASTATLLRFGKVTTANIRPAMEVMTDLAVKTGSVESASTLLAKALADPTKAAGKLSRAGVVLTKQQQKQIAAFVKAGKVGEAQKVILDELARTTGGAAAASVGKYGDAINMLGDASEDAKKALAEGFMPVIERVAGKLQDLVADPAAMQSLRDIGSGLADAFDEAINFAEKINWKAVGDGLGKAAGFAKSLFDAFANMPPEVQATIIGLAGLNKLTGGAVSGIVGELGKGLIKGVLGMNAGVVNINAGVVNGPGGGLPGGGKIPPVAGIVTPAIGAGVMFDLEAFNRKVTAVGGPLDRMRHKVDGVNGALTGHGGPGRGGSDQTVHGALTGHSGPGRGTTADVGKKITDLHHGAVDAIDATGKASVDAQSRTKQEIASRVQAGASQTSNATTGAGSRVTAQSIGNTSRIVGAIQSSVPSVSVVTNVNVSAAQVVKSTTTQTRYGRSGGSAADDDPNGAGR